jgi:hypothetical protein
VTADGKIEFMNNRTSGDVVDPRTGRLLVNVVPNSYRSVDGAWVVEFPNPDYGGSSKSIPIKSGLNGELAGQLDIKIASDDEEEAWGWARGAFCGTSGRFIAASKDTVKAFAIPSGKKIAEFPAKSWQEPASAGGSNLVTVGVQPGWPARGDSQRRAPDPARPEVSHRVLNFFSSRAAYLILRSVQ